MSGVSIRVEIKDQELRAALQRVSGFGLPATRAMGAVLVDGTLRRFKQQRGPDGQAWAGLNPAYQAIKRGPGILRATSALSSSTNFKAAPTEVRVGVGQFPYARIHQFGGTIKPKSAKYLRFKLAGGFVRARSVTIPARPYLGIDREDEQDLLDTLETLILRRARAR
jgi:phage virion morphogenesis protein